MIFNLSAGGGGLSATDAILRVSALAGSTVTITKGAVSKSDLGHENADDSTFYDYYFIIHASQFDGVNPWTVTATLGANTDSTTVIINAADEYDVSLKFLPTQVVNYTMLYDNSYGNATTNQCSSVTGGWTSTGYKNSDPDNNNLRAITNGANYIRCNSTYSATASSRYYCMGGTANLIGFSNYDYYFANYKVVVAINNTISARTVKMQSGGTGVASMNNTALADGNGLLCIPLESQTDAYAYVRSWPSDGSGNNGNSEILLYNCAAIKADDTATLATRCGLTNNTTADILGSSADLNKLFSTQYNVEILSLLCTGDFMATAIGNSDFMAAYSASMWKPVLEANEHWAKFLAMAA